MGYSGGAAAHSGIGVGSTRRLGLERAGSFINKTAEKETVSRAWRARGEGGLINETAKEETVEGG